VHNFKRQSLCVNGFNGYILYKPLLREFKWRTLRRLKRKSDCCLSYSKSRHLTGFCFSMLHTQQQLSLDIIILKVYNIMRIDITLKYILITI
jgi:hypothetical protein